MLDPHTISSPLTAFTAGLVTSIHCIGMCGPLALFLAPKADDPAGTHAALGLYHSLRIVGYALIGAALGWFGQMGLDAFNATPVRFFPWALVLFFILVAVGADHWLPRPAFLNRWMMKVGARLRKLPRMGAAAGLGVVTPFLPCGPLYLVFGIALVSGSVMTGAEFLFAFGLGTLPLLYLGQTQFFRLRGRVSALWMMRLQRVVALSMAVLIAWRLRGTFGGVGPEVGCPFCP